MMADFKKGDWVRVTSAEMVQHWNTYWTKESGVVSEIGTPFKVVDIDTRGIRVTAGFVDKGPHWFESQIEPWAPRVGERVKYKNTKYGNATVVSNVEDGRVRVDTHGEFGICTESISSLEPLVGPTADKLTIQAGKFYKTRAGRKVGPADLNPDKFNIGADHIGRKAFATLPGVGDVDINGIWLCGDNNNQNDLIAEWPAEATATPTTNVAATVDAQAEEYGPVVPAEVAAAKPKFKVGDRVRVVKLGCERGGSNHAAAIGDEFMLVRMDRTGAFWKTSGPDFYEHEIIIASTPAIVCLIENGQPLPATRPYVHADTTSAATEAKRMAGVHKGQEFGVFTLAGKPEMVAKTYAHEWQRLAANGNRLPAINALRSISDIGLKAANDAVKDWESRQPTSVRLWGVA